MRKFLRRTVLSLVLLGAILFGAAGTLAWPQAWIYLALAAIMSIGLGFWLARHDPALLAERLRPLIQRDQKRWDKLLMVVMLALWIGWLILMALDAKRFHWSEMPLALQVVGAVLICLCSYVVWLTFKANSYAAPVVKIQRERGHQVVSTGPYRYVRHPMYAGALLFLGRRAAAARLVVGSCRRGRPDAAHRPARRARGAHPHGRARRLCGLCRGVRYRLVPRLW